MCPILCGNTNFGCKWSHLEEIKTALYLIVHIWLLWYQFGIWICLDKSLSSFRFGSSCPILSGILCPILCGNKNIGLKLSHLGVYNCIMLYSYLFECFNTNLVFEFIWIKAYPPWGSMWMLSYVRGIFFTR